MSRIINIDRADYHKLFEDIRKKIVEARSTAAYNINTLQVLTNFEIGRLIVEYQQSGKKRAEYGKEIVKDLSKRLKQEFGRGFSEDNLGNMRRFYLTYHKKTAISETLSRISSTGTTKNSLVRPFTLSWSHYVFLMGIKNEAERSFYEIESSVQNWSKRELQRQFNSGLYERLALSRDKEGILKLASEGQIITRPQDILKEPMVLEFLGLEEKERYSESDLESAIIDKLEHFLLELGKGFLFEARQKRFTLDEDHFYVDLVFYNRLLRCYVLVDLKIGKLTHQDLGQMQMYVNYFDRFLKTNQENPTVGIILCHKKHDALVEITLPKESQIYASEYQLYLPSKEELRQKLIQWIVELGDERTKTKRKITNGIKSYLRKE